MQICAYGGERVNEWYIKDDITIVHYLQRQASKKNNNSEVISTLLITEITYYIKMKL